MNAARGRIELIVGCMFAGKTTRLIERLAAELHAGRRVTALKHATDDRYDAAALATHDGKRLEAHPVGNAADFERAGRDADVVGLDEVHFFDFALVESSQRLRDSGKTIVLAGLDHDMWGREFPWIARLKEVADDVRIVSFPCGSCGRPARYSQRMTPYHGDLVGGPEAYEARCPECFEPLDAPAPVYGRAD